ncbi:hypothetical protein TNCV_4567331 [Trichonephila clavipes]|nr:hypothetical protein TNCV_4567331 [Trichonephila clavipes]
MCWSGPVWRRVDPKTVSSRLNTALISKNNKYPQKRHYDDQEEGPMKQQQLFTRCITSTSEIRRRGIVTGHSKAESVRRRIGERLQPHPVCWRCFTVATDTCDFRLPQKKESMEL